MLVVVDERGLASIAEQLVDGIDRKTEKPTIPSIDRIDELSQSKGEDLYVLGEGQLVHNEKSSSPR
jgi:hypothetical protein